MPIIDVELFANETSAPRADLAHCVADALESVFGAEPGHVWVRLHVNPASLCAEHSVALAAQDLPTFITVLHASPPEVSARQAEAVKVCNVLAKCLGCSPERVHVEYAPPGQGRMDFGGTLVL